MHLCTQPLLEPSSFCSARTSPGQVVTGPVHDTTWALFQENLRSRGVRSNLLLCFPMPAALLQYIQAFTWEQRCSDLPYWLGQEEFWPHSQAPSLGCCPRRGVLGSAPCGCSAAGPGISPSPEASPGTCPCAAPCGPHGTGGVCWAPGGGWALLGVLGWRPPSWWCARCTWEGLSCLGCCHSKIIDANHWVTTTSHYIFF